MSEAALVAEILLKLDGRPDALVWRNNAGLLIGAGGRPIRAGLKGSGDVAGVVRGRAVMIEAKAGRTAWSPVQRAFAAAWTEAGGVYVLARSWADVEAGLAAAGVTPDAATEAGR